MIRYLTYREIVAYHQALMTEHGQSGRIIAPDRLAAAVARPEAEAFGVEVFPTVAQKAAALLQAIVVGHPFSDGNKRAGAGAMLAFLELNGAQMPDDSDELYDLVVAVTVGELREVDAIAARIRDLFGGVG